VWYAGDIDLGCTAAGGLHGQADALNAGDGGAIAASEIEDSQGDGHVGGGHLSRAVVL